MLIDWETELETKERMLRGLLEALPDGMHDDDKKARATRPSHRLAPLAAPPTVPAASPCTEHRPCHDET